MNIEQAYIKFDRIEEVIGIIERRLNGDLQNVSLSEQLLVPDSYETILRNSEKRKVAVSVPEEGWITIVESKEINDNAMLLELSKELKSDVMTFIQYDSVGAWGYIEMTGGTVVDSYFSENDEDIEGMIEEKKKEKKISVPIFLFREVVKERENGWIIVQKKKKQ